MSSLAYLWVKYLIKKYTSTNPAYQKYQFIIPTVHIINLCLSKSDKWTIKVLKLLLPYILEPEKKSFVERTIYYFNNAQDIRRIERKYPPKRRKTVINYTPNIPISKDTSNLIDIDLFPPEHSLPKSISTTNDDNPLGWQIINNPDFGIGDFKGSLDLPKQLDHIKESLIIKQQRRITKEVTTTDIQVISEDETDSDIVEIMTMPESSEKLHFKEKRSKNNSIHIQFNNNDDEDQMIEIIEENQLQIKPDMVNLCFSI